AAVGVNNPNMPWAELERRLSWNRPRPGHPETRYRPPYEPPPDLTAPGGAGDPASGRSPGLGPRAGQGAWRAGAVPYAELHCHTHFSFLDGASHPDELVGEAARPGLEAPPR